MKLVLVTLRIGVGIPKGNTGVGWGRVGRGVGIAVRSPHQARVGWGGDTLGVVWGFLPPTNAGGGGGGESLGDPHCAKADF